MRIDPQVGALRGDSAARRAMQLALEAARDEWLGGAAADAAAELERYGEGTLLQDCPQLLALTTREGAALTLIEALIGPMLEQLAANPLGHVPLRHQRSDNVATIQLLRAGRAALSLLAYDEAEAKPASASFSDGERHEILLAGALDVAFLDIIDETGNGASIETTGRRLVAGEVITCVGERSTRIVKQVHGRCVMLRLARSSENPSDTRQFSFLDGRLIHRSSGSRTDSRHEMAMAVLGRMGRKDAAPILAELAMEGGNHIRWQSLRECLALDTATGFMALIKIAADPSDPLSTPAGALRASLLETHPQLAQLEALQCPA